MTFETRGFCERDANVVAAMLRLAVKATAPKYYTAEQATVWAKQMPDAARLITRCQDGRFAFVGCDVGDSPVAFGDLEADGHLDFLYCHPDFVGRGIASALYNHLEGAAKKLNLAEIYLEASEAALTFFRHKGFETTKRRGFDMDGVKMHNYAMRKGLNR